MPTRGPHSTLEGLSKIPQRYLPLRLRRPNSLSRDSQIALLGTCAFLSSDTIQLAAVRGPQRQAYLPFGQTLRHVQCHMLPVERDNDESPDCSPCLSLRSFSTSVSKCYMRIFSSQATAPLVDWSSPRPYPVSKVSSIGLLHWSLFMLPIEIHLVFDLYGGAELRYGIL